MIRKEQSLHKAVCAYIRLQYPSVIFCSESGGINQTKAQAGISKMLRSSAGLPDLIILEPRHGFHGMFFEFKKETVFLKDGKTLKSDPHLREQQEIINRLLAKGYHGGFGWEFDGIKKAIDQYMS